MNRKILAGAGAISAAFAAVPALAAAASDHLPVWSKLSLPKI